MDDFTTNIISYAELKAKKAKLEESGAALARSIGKIPPFRMREDPVVCPELEWAEDEEWPCEWCGENDICTWQSAAFDEEEELPCCFWEDRLEDREFLVPMKVGIFNLDGQKIGEASGWFLNPDTIIAYERDAFFAMDGISHLLMCAHHLIIKQKRLFGRASRLGTVPFITRLSLYDQFRTLELEEEILKFLLEGYGIAIYSLGYTELDDDDFFEYQDGKWCDYWVKRLLELGWRCEDELWYASRIAASR